MAGEHDREFLMMKISTMPKETLAQLLLYLAENEKFESVSRKLGTGVSVEEVRAVLRELAVEIAKEAAGRGDDSFDVKKAAGLSAKAKDIISYLSPHEEKTLLSAFGFPGNKK